MQMLRPTSPHRSKALQLSSESCYHIETPDFSLRKFDKIPVASERRFIICLDYTKLH